MQKIENVVVFGASGALGQGFIDYYCDRYPSADIHAISRKSVKGLNTKAQPHQLDYLDEAALKECAESISSHCMIDRVIVATGILHSDDLMPEKTFKTISQESLQYLHQVNTVIPALIAKHFLPKLRREETSVFAALSARVASISDNKLGGWYAYRSSKAALNMLIKTFAIEMNMKNKNAVVVGLHPGTVDSELSKPFQKNIPQAQLFTAEQSVRHLIDVIDNLDSDDSGNCYAWDGAIIQA
ncbi:MAG: SDR family NAD(P)-dependent oxidoreductase [Cellvibrionaceae bacterium]|nr:SDR family NAD(P)-dependent oxidoreductase [Cellvibrionaceae bacterium]